MKLNRRQLRKLVIESIWDISSKMRQSSDDERRKVALNRGRSDRSDSQKTISQKNAQGKLTLPSLNKKRIEIEYTFSDRYIQPDNAPMSYQKTLGFRSTDPGKEYDIFVVGKNKGSKGTYHTWIYKIDGQEVGRLEVPNSSDPGKGIKDPDHIFWKTLKKDLGIGYRQYEMIIKHAQERLK